MLNPKPQSSLLNPKPQSLTLCSLQERRSKAVAQLIRARGGAVTAQELAPFMDPVAGLSFTCHGNLGCRPGFRV